MTTSEPTTLIPTLMGATPALPVASRLTLSMSAKGLMQPEVTLSYATPDELERVGIAQMRRVMDALRRAFPTPAGLPVDGAVDANDDMLG